MVPPAALMRSTSSFGTLELPVHHQREAGELGLDLVEDVEMEGLLALELEGAMRGADGAGEGVAAVCLTKSSASAGSVRQALPSSTLMSSFHAAEHAELGLDGDALGMRLVDDALGDGDVLGERVMGGVDHHGTEEAGIDAIVACRLVPMVQMDGEDGFGKDLAGGADDGSSMRLSVYFRAPLEIWMMKGALDWMQPLNRPMACSALLIL